MMQRICPICDQTMKSAHYCRNCKSWIRQPWMREVTYYLNERHPQNEQSCSYHNAPGPAQPAAPASRPFAAGQGAASKPFAAGQGTASKPFAARQEAASKSFAAGQEAVPKPFVTRQEPAQKTVRVQPWKAGASAEPNRPRAEKQNAGSRRGKASGYQKIILLAIVIVIAIQFLSSIIVAVRNVVYTFSNNAVEYDIDLGEFRGEDDWAAEEEPDYRELEDDAVIAAGEACNSMGHFPVQGQSLKEPVCGIIEAYGYQIVDISTFSSNEVYGGGESWYRTWLSIEVEGGSGDGYQYVDLNYDTATGELHQIEVFLEDPRSAAGMTEILLKLLYEQGAVDGDSGWLEEIGSEMVSQFMQKEDFYFACDGVVIDGYFYDNGCNVYISR